LFELIDKMRFSEISAIALTLVSVASSAALLPRNDLLTDLQNQAMEALKQAEASGTIEKRSCSLSNAYARRNWFVSPASLKQEGESNI
jgi:tyrosinase